MTEQLYRWVKASERTPEILNAHEKECRLDGKNSTGILVEAEGGGMCFEYRDYVRGWMIVHDLSRIEWLEPYTPSPSGSLEEIAQKYSIDFNNYTGNECGLSHDEWQLEQIVDKIREIPTLEAINLVRRLAGASRPTLNPEEFIKALREGNPYTGEINFTEDKRIGYEECCNKAQELLNQKEK